MRRFLIVLPILFAAFAFTSFFTACSSPPDAEMDAAETAVRQMNNAGAEELVPNLYDKTIKYHQEAKSLNEQGKYAEAKKRAELTVMMAEKCVKEAERLSKARSRN